jgi:mono/diheme cytochrome c family protein
MKMPIRLFFLAMLGIGGSVPQAFAASACTVDYDVTVQDATSFTAKVTVTNMRKGLKSWAVRWRMPAAQHITGLRDGALVQRKAKVLVKGLAGNRKLAKNGSVVFEFDASHGGTNPPPTRISLNGRACTIQSSTPDDNGGMTPSAQNGQAIYSAQCASCHDGAAAPAPEAWSHPLTKAVIQTGLATSPLMANISLSNQDLADLACALDNSQCGAATPNPAAAGCEANYQVANQWNDGFKGAVKVKHTGPALSGWTTAWTMPDGQKIVNLWDGGFSQNGNDVAVTNAEWNAAVADGASFEFGFVASHGGTNTAPSKLTVNGVQCALTASGGTTPDPTPTPDASCTVAYQVSAQWDTGFTAGLKITNGGSAIDGWKLAWEMPDNQQITQLWNGQYTQNNAHVEVSNAGWNGKIAQGANVEFGFNASHSGSNRIPGSISLNGTVCTVTAAGGDGGGGAPTTVVPAVPTGFTANVVDNAEVKLSWSDQSGNETGFRIERRNVGDAAWNKLADTAANATAYSDSTVAMGSDYEYRLSAFNATGSSADVVLPVSVLSLLDYGKAQYQHQSCGTCHGADGSGGIARSLTGYTAAQLTSLTNAIAGTMPPPASPPACTGNCALGIARYIVEVLAPNANGGTPVSDCKGNPPPSRRSLRLLTRQEYQNTVNDLLGLTTSLIYQLPEENRVDGFDNNAATNLVTGIRLEAYLSLADSLASQAVLSSWNKLVPCAQQDNACARQFIAGFGKRAYRRPLTEAEITDYLANFAGGSFTDAVTTTVMRMLVSPHFLYRSELGELQADGGYKLSPYETANTLSYLFLGSMPDDALFSAADQNQLDTPQQRLTQAARLIALPRARAQVGNFVGQWLLSSSPYTLPEKDQGVYPRYTAAVKAALSEELIGFFNHVAFDSTQSFPELFTADYVYANQTLADYYGLSGPTGSAFQETAVPDGSRTGLLTLGAVLSRYANSNESHPFKRGGFLYKRVLCHDLPLPANAGLIVAPQPDPNATTRERFDFHSKSGASCTSCHQFLDEPGFGFENYDGAGIYRATENGNPIDAAGTMRGMETFTPEEQVQFSDLKQLSQLVSTSPRAAQCVARQYYRYATGRREANADGCTLDSFIQSYSNNGYNLQTLLLGIVNAPGFNLRSGQ